MAKEKQQTTMSDTALARRHRIAVRNKHRSIPTLDTDEARNSKCPRVAFESEPMAMVSSSIEPTKASPEEILESIRKKKPHITGIKKQSRYDPGVAMSKEELKAWRKEARRVRNRESAAASRKKNHEVIGKLESQTKEAQTKYNAALQYILELEEKLRRSESSSSTFCPSVVLRQDLDEARKVTPESSEKMTQNQVRRLWKVEVQNNLDKNTPYHPFAEYQSNHQPSLNSQKHIIDNTIIRPIACV